MTTTQLFLVFAGVMLGIALLAIVVDWAGKPIRRRFVPKIYRYPEEMAAIRARQMGDPTATTWSRDSFVLPEMLPSDEPAVLSDGRSEWSDSFFEVPFGAHDDDADNSRIPSGAVLAAGLDDEDEGEPPAAEPEPRPLPQRVAAADDRPRGWQPGQYVYNLTDNGADPTPELVRERYWQNVATLRGADALGDGNVARMAAGDPPVRRNRRSGVLEELQLQATTYELSGGRLPTPAWPGAAVDPFDDAH